MARLEGDLRAAQNGTRDPQAIAGAAMNEHIAARRRAEAEIVHMKETDLQIRDVLRAYNRPGEFRTHICL
jgi:hypothetical protein